MAKNILSNKTYTLKLSKEEGENLARFCIISSSIFDAVSSLLEQIKAIEPYVEEWEKLEVPISKIIRKMNKRGKCHD